MDPCIVNVHGSVHRECSWIRASWMFMDPCIVNQRQ